MAPGPVVSRLLGGIPDGSLLSYGFSLVKLQAVTAAGAQFGQPGYELDLLYVACLAALVPGGPGPFSISELLRK